MLQFMDVYFISLNFYNWGFWWKLNEKWVFEVFFLQYLFVLIKLIGIFRKRSLIVLMNGIQVYVGKDSGYCGKRDEREGFLGVKL